MPNAHQGAVTHSLKTAAFEVILPSLFMCVHIPTIAAVLAVMLGHMDSVAALKCNGYKLEYLLARQLEKGNVHWRGPSM